MRLIILTQLTTDDVNQLPLGIIAKKFTEEHETVTYDDATGLGTITITEHAQSSLGDVVFVELPAVDTDVEQGGKCFLYSSLSCSMLKSRINSPYSSNWSSRECEGSLRYC